MNLSDKRHAGSGPLAFIPLTPPLAERVASIVHAPHKGMGSLTVDLFGRSIMREARMMDQAALAMDNRPSELATFHKTEIGNYRKIAQRASIRADRCRF
jgi:ATP-dependent Zn protease